jgi:tripartite-type tricarboxylate transporter receptor subunit TctC
MTNVSFRRSASQGVPSLSRRSFLGATAGLSVLAVTGCSASGKQESFPSRSVELVNPFAAGGSHDAHARAIGSTAKPVFKQPVQVSIRDGGGGTIGADYVANKAKADGYTMLLGDPGSVLIQPLIQSVSYSRDDLSAVAQIDESPIVFVSLPKAPWNSLDELLEAAKKDPGSISYGAGPRFGNDQMAVELLVDETGVDLKHVPIDGGGNVYRATLAGDVEVGALFPASVTKDIIEGRLKPLAVTGNERVPGLDDVPTCAELGYPVEWLMFRTIFVAADTPDDRQKALADRFESLLQEKKFLELLESMGEQPGFLRGQELSDKLDRIAERVSKIVA